MQLNKLDSYQRQQIQLRKNFEVVIEQQIETAEFDFSSDPDEELIFQGNTFKLWDGQHYIELPKTLLELESLEYVFTPESIKSLLNQEEQAQIMKLLPEIGNKEEILNDLLSGDRFFFGSPLVQFQNMLRTGYFTQNREHCDKLDRQLRKQQFQDYQQNLLTYFQQPNYQEAIKQKFRQQRRRQLSPPSPLSQSFNEAKKLKKVKTRDGDINSADSLSTSSSQSISAPQYINQPVQQVQPNQQLQVPTSSSQFLFANAPITQLPAYTSTSLLTNQMTLAYIQARKQVRKVGQPNQVNQGGLNQQTKIKLESTVPTGQSDKQWLESFWKQELERYKNPLLPYIFTCIDGSRAAVAPATKKLLSGMSSKPRQHELLKNDRPPYVTILSLVRDASARLPKGYGTRADIMNLVKDSQFINENLADEKMSSIISGALDRLHQSQDPCVKYDQEKKIWIYLHHDRDESYHEWQQQTPVIQPNKMKRKTIQ